MQKRCIGGTNIEVSVIGLGTVKFGRTEGVHYPHAFTLPSDKTLDELLHHAQALGINLLDTAPAYGMSETRLGKLLQGMRQSWVLSTKVGEEFVDGQSRFDFSKQAIIASIERSLKRLRTDYLDVVLVHSNGKDQEIIEQDQVFMTLENLKKQGKIRAFGMSTKTVAGGLMTIAAADIAMVTLNPLHSEDREVIAYAHQQQKSIFIKKAFASGHLEKFSSANPIAEALQFIFSVQGITSVIVGTINLKHLEENVKCAGVTVEKSAVI